MTATYTVTRTCPTCKKKLSWQKPKNRGAVHSFAMAKMAEHWQSDDCTSKKPSPVVLRAEKIVETLVEAIVEDGIDEMSTRELAEAIDASPTQTSSACYKLCDMDMGWRRISPTTVYVDVRERNFGSVTHQRKCQGWMVTREHLASIIKNLREETRS